MPNRDNTGPEGKGPRTGRGAGDCPLPPSWVNYEQDREKAAKNKRPMDGRGKGLGLGYKTRGGRKGIK